MARIPGTLAIAILAGAVACTDGPTSPRPSIPLRLCIADEPWVAFRNEGGAWTRVPAADGAFSFDATARVALAYAFDRAYGPYLVVEQASAAQLADQHSCTPRPAAGAYTVTGVVRSREAQASAWLRYAGGGAGVYASESTFTLPASATPGDLVAVRMPPATSTGQFVDRVIVRRGQVLAAGTSLVIDFAAPEAVAPERADIAWTGPGAGAGVIVWDSLAAQGLYLSSANATVDPTDRERTAPVAMLPAAVRRPGDLHWLQLEELTVPGAAVTRQVDAWASDLRTVQLRFGAEPAAATFAVLASTPALRLRGEVPYQPDYGGSLAISLSQRNVSPTIVQLNVTREYYAGTPRAWTVEVPDLRRLQGYPASVSLADGATYYSLRLTSRSGVLPFARPRPRDGDVTRGARRTGVAR